MRQVSQQLGDGWPLQEGPRAWFGILERLAFDPFTLWTFVLGLALLTSRTLTLARPDPDHPDRPSPVTRSDR